MPPDHARTFGGGLTETSLSPYGLLATILCAILIWVLPRKSAVLPLLCINLLVPLDQAVVVGGLHFFVARIVVVVGLLRLWYEKLKPGPDALVSRHNNIDSAFTWCIALQASAAVILFADIPALINQSGFLLDSLGTYYLIRWFLQDQDDIYRTLKFLAVVVALLAICMTVEQVDLVNVFGYLTGGQLAPAIRDGKIRSQGSFMHPITAGCFAAALTPLFLMLWKTGKAKVMVVIGIVGSTVMTMTSNSSTPLLTYMGALLALALWPIREKMRILRWGLVFGIGALALAMKAPVWFVIARIDLTGSSSGYHRAVIIDQFIRHFFDWWLVGVRSTGAWGWDLWDVQNTFVNVGESGGLAALVCLILLICRCFSRIGNARKAAADLQQQFCLWCVGAALFANIMAFFGIYYYDQSKVGWFMLLAIVSAVTVPILAETRLTAIAAEVDSCVSEHAAETCDYA